MNATVHAPAAVPSAVDDPVRMQIGDDRIATVCFDRSKSSANVLNSDLLRRLGAIVDELRRERNLRGVIFTSAKQSVFIAGADLRELAAATDREALVDLGQETFSAIAALPCVTIAAIHGACAGGGVELALACDYRIASSDRATRIGLPEVNLGLIPAWGGSTRLPRLVGLSRALKIILRGDLMPARKAAKLGLVNALAPRERLDTLARRFIAKGKASPRTFQNLASLPAAPIVAAIARKSVRKKTLGHYPAPLTAIDVVTKSLARTIPQSLAAERAAILELAGTEISRNLIRVFFLQDRAKHLPAPLARSVTRTAVIGAGVMGAGIAQWLAARGLEVVLRDIGPDELARGLQRAETLFTDAKRRGLLSAAEAQAAMDRIHPAEVPVDLSLAGLVIEAAVERMDLKKQVFAELEQHTRDDAVLATNTSALSVTDLSRSLRHPGRVVGLHFFNPVHRMQLVEVVRGELASAEAIATAVAFAQRIGKLPVVVRDRPGFLVNRILVPYLLEAAHLFQAGADPERIDEAMLAFGMPMGPLRLLDEIGLDVGADVAKTLADAFPERLRLPETLAGMLAAGLKGRKSERGFYKYRNGHSNGVCDEARPFQRSRDAAGLDLEQLQQRMVFLMVNEAARCLEEHIVETPQEVDFAMIMGAGFAPFRGGPLRYADAIGHARVTAACELLAERLPQFTPSDRLRVSRKFYDD